MDENNLIDEESYKELVFKLEVPELPEFQIRERVFLSLQGVPLDYKRPVVVDLQYTDYISFIPGYKGMQHTTSSSHIMSNMQDALQFTYQFINLEYKGTLHISITKLFNELIQGFLL